MSVLGLFAAQCDRCGEQGPAATDLTSARVASTSEGWALVRDGGKALDYCPQHAGRPTPPPLVETTKTWVCPECEQGKHGNCNGWAWNFDADDKTQCQCPEVHP